MLPYCTVCKHYIEISTGEDAKDAVGKHIRGEVHQRNLKLLPKVSESERTPTMDKGRLPDWLKME